MLLFWSLWVGKHVQKGLFPFRRPCGLILYKGILRRCVLWLRPLSAVLEMGLLLPRAIANCSGNGNWMSISYCLQLEKKKKGQRWGQKKKPLMPFRILVDIFKPERTDGLDQQERRRLVVSANDSAPANTNPAVFHTYSHSLLLLFPLPIAIKCYADALECYTIKEQDSDEWGGGGGGGGGENAGAKRRAWRRFMFFCLLQFEKRLVISSPSGSYS